MTGAGQGRVLVLNAGSSSLKFALFCGLERRYHGQVEGIGARPRFVFGQAEAEPMAAATRHAAALARILDALRDRGIRTADLAACGHRLVHAGTRFVFPVLIDAERLAAIDELRELAPLHNGFGLDAIAAMRAAAPTCARRPICNGPGSSSIPGAMRGTPRSSRRTARAVRCG
jgi:acetate kinase